MRGNGKINAAARAVAALSAGARRRTALGHCPCGTARGRGDGGRDAAAAGTARGSGAPGATHRRRAPATAGATERVIVFLKNQWAGSGSPIRSSLIRAAQAPYLKRLSELGATGVHGYVLVDAIAARVPAAALPVLTASPAWRR